MRLSIVKSEFIKKDKGKNGVIINIFAYSIVILTRIIKFKLRNAIDIYLKKEFTLIVFKAYKCT